MAYNPPEVKQELEDTLFCVGQKFTYETVRTGTDIVRVFTLVDGSKIQAYSHTTIWFDDKKRDMYNTKLALMEKYLDA